MKLVVFGLSLSSSWGNGHATLWRGLCRALIARGHQVVFFERDVPYYAAHRDLTTLDGGELCLYPAWERVLPYVRSHLADADVAMVTSYCPDGLAATELVLDSRAPVRAFYDLDTPVTLERLRAGQPVDYIGPRGFRDFDLVLSYAGGPALDELRARLGARRVAPLYGSVDPSLHRPAPAIARFACDLSYLGTYAADRQAALQALFVEPARRLPHRRFLLGGSMYPQDFPWTGNTCFVRHIAPPDHPGFYGSSRVTLNVTRRAMAACGWCPSGRLFEAAACGTPVLTDPWPGLEEFFVPGREILVARDTEEAVSALEFGDDELRALAVAARRRTLARHTAEQRADELVELLARTAGGDPLLEAPRPRASASPLAMET